MEPLKYEEQFENALKAREIEPSENSWNLLEERLGEHKKSGNRSYWWIGIAASIIGGILILSLVFKNESAPGTPQIVNTPTKTLEDKKKPENAVAADKSENLVAHENTKAAPDTEKSKIRTQKASTVIVKNTSEAVAENTSNAVKSSAKKVKVIQLDPKSDLISEKLLDNNINAVLAQVSSAQKNGIEVTDAEVDALLAQAAAKIEKEKKYTYKADNISANALLQDVETDIDNSFREKIFDILKEGFNKARSAVANRNN